MHFNHNYIKNMYEATYYSSNGLSSTARKQEFLTNIFLLQFLAKIIQYAVHIKLKN